MKTPPFLLGAAFLFWGWQSSLLIPGVVMAVIVESARWTKARWEFGYEDFSRVWAFCSLLFLAAGVYAFTSNEGPSAFGDFFSNPVGNARNAGASSQRTAAALFRWLPMIFFPFLAVQLFSTREGTPLAAISFLLRRRQRQAQRAGLPVPPGRDIDITYYFLGGTLLAAAVHPSENRSFFWGLSVMLGWTLWSQRSRRFGFPFWAIALALAVGVGFAAQIGITELQRLAERFNPSWFLRTARRVMDPEESRTALGQVGGVKGSPRIVVRLTPHEGSEAPVYLREASYRVYRMPSWSAGSSRESFESVIEDTPDSGNWTLLPGRTNTFAVNIACFLESWRSGSPAGLLPLPAASGRLEQLRAYVMSKNTAGAVFVEGPGLVIFDARYGPGLTVDSPPGTATITRLTNIVSNPADAPVADTAAVTDVGTTNEDLMVPTNEVPALEAIIAELGLRGLPRDEVLRRVGSYFETRFTYQIWQSLARLGTNETYLSRFLQKTRAGHCEYFATATVLLLRQLEMPTRYATGYMVHEPSGDGYVVRLRDAHAWCLVWNPVTQVWDDFDTTPGTWIEAERQRGSAFEWLGDAWTRIKFEIAKLRWGQTNLRQYLLIGIIPALAFLLYQIIFKRGRRKRIATPDQGVGIPLWPGLDSEFYKLEKQLAEAGVPRGASETLQAWLARVAVTPGLADRCAALQEILRLHYRYRFDPLGLSATDRDDLRRAVQACINPSLSSATKM